MKPALAALALALMAGVVRSQDRTANPPAFEVASIKPHVFGGARGGCSGMSISGSRVTIPCMSVRNLIMRAYDVRAYQISGGPASLTDMADTAYDIAAKAEGEGTPAMEQVRVMMQTLLADRFQLKLHRETKELPVYALVADKNGPKLKESATDAKASIGFRMGGIKGSLTASKETMAQFALYLSNEAGRPVLDETGLAGSYDFTLEWTREQPQILAGAPPPPAANAPAPDPSGPSLFTAVQEQLGLRLRPQKSPVELLVIDHVTKPSEN
jgi:uncharacterized protein (TIGR03435 family)